METWQEQVAAVPGIVLQGEADDHLRRAVDAYEGGTGQQLGDQRVAALRDDLERSFFDGYRFVSAEAGRTTYRDAQQYVSWATARMDKDARHPAAVVAALVSARSSAATAVEDLAVTVRPAAVAAAPQTAAAREALDKARQQLASADDMLTKANTEAAVVHAGHAWRSAYDGLRGLGITYDGDQDGDGLADVAELSTGASPLVGDSDADGLSDRFEIERLLGLAMPGEADTDGNGVPDGQEDHDGDGLDAAAEQGLSTNPAEPDSDGDGVEDGAEVTARTDPNSADSDGDTLRDGSEPRLGLDPLRTDTDADGVRDDADVQRIEAPAPTGWSISLLGSGDLLEDYNADALPAEEVTGAAGASLVGQAYDISLGEQTPDGFVEAQLGLPYDPQQLGDSQPQDLRVMYLDEHNGVWREAAAQQTLDAQQRRVLVTVDHFSVYALFDIRSWQQTWTGLPNPCRSRSGGGSDVVLLDLALVLDSSGSMSWNDPQGLRRTAAKNFVDALLPEDRSAVVDFDDRSVVLQGLTEDKTAVKQAIDRIDDSGGTNIAAGVRTGTDVLLANGDTQRARIAILLTDGEGYYDSSLTDRARQNNIVIYTIGLGSSIDEPLLRSIASGTGGQYYHVRTAEDLPDAFRRISDDTGGGVDATTDTDGDGLTDCLETNGIRGPDGVVWTSDPALTDTDGDGLSDDEEVGERVDFARLAQTYGSASLRTQADGGAVAHKAPSNPRAADTDGDGLRDDAEEDLESDPRRRDTDGDGLADGTEVHDIGSSPKHRNTDGDDWRDGYEVANADERGLDPIVHNTKTSKLSYAVSFAKGMSCGSWCFDDNIAWLSGNLISGYLGYGDAIDLVKNVISANWVSAGFDIFAVVPFVGDTSKTVTKVTKFVQRVPRKFNEVTRLVATAKRLPDSVKKRALKALMLGRYGRLTDLGFTDDIVLRLARGERTDLRVLADASASSMRRNPPAAVRDGIRWSSSGRVGENRLRTALSLSEAKRVYTSLSPRRSRVHDGTEVVPGLGRRNHEVKTGVTNRTDDLKQCRKDGQIQRDPKIPVAEVVWHFVGNSGYNSIGPSRALLQCLQEEGLRFVIHRPTS